jgi:hypothetical protein
MAMSTPVNEVSPALDRLTPSIKQLRRFVRVLEHLLRLAEALDGDRLNRAIPYLGLIFLYGQGMVDVVHARRPDGRSLWNAPALAALCRPLHEAYLSLFYFVIESPPSDEAEFRQLLLVRHMIYKRMDLMQCADQANPTVARECFTAQTDWHAINAQLRAHPFLSKLPKKVARKLAVNGDKYIIESLQSVWDRSGLPAHLYGPLFRLLSQYAHATPYAAGNLRFHKAGYEDGAVNMMLPIGVAIACVLKSIEHSAALHPEIAANVPQSFSEFMAPS